jgi:hypothetical protein
LLARNTKIVRIGDEFAELFSAVRLSAPQAVSQVQVIEWRLI